MLATGLTLKDIPCGKYGTLDKYVPDGDYVVIKFARWAFEKFKGVEDKLGTQMRAVGEVMSIGKKPSRKPSVLWKQVAMVWGMQRILIKNPRKNF